MSLADVVVSVSEFDLIYGHMLTHRPRERNYRNMHMREACQREGERGLRYLHAMRVRPGEARAIDGMMSGPDVLWEYELVRTRTRTQLVVTTDEADSRARDRIGRRFLSEILARVAEEQDGVVHHPKLSPGQLYLRRHHPPMAATHPTCRSAVDAGALDQRFVSRILPWGFRLLCP